MYIAYDRMVEESLVGIKKHKEIKSQLMFPNLTRSIGSSNS